MFQQFDAPVKCFYLHEGHCRVYTGVVMGSNGERAAVDFGEEFGTAFPLLEELYSDELLALKDLQRSLNKRMMANVARIMLLDGSMEASTVSVKSD